MYEIVVGRTQEDKKKFGLKGTILLGKHYVKMGETTSLSNDVFLDITRSHVVFVCGKRGSGKSYTMGVIAEGMAKLPKQIARNTAILLFDTMGVYWTMKYKNKRETELLEKAGLEPEAFDARIFTPFGYFDEFKEKGIPTDFSFALNPADLSPSDWCLTFSISMNDPAGIAIQRIVSNLRKSKMNYTVDDIIKAIQDDKKTDMKTKDAVETRFEAAKTWGLFRENATSIDELISRDKITIIDISCYASSGGSENLRALVIGMISQRLFNQRMIARKDEEFRSVEKENSIFAADSFFGELDTPLVWLVVDEAHEFLPSKGKTASSDALITILREGRQPGISLVLASQQPGKIHTDVMTQSDIVISHRLTSQVDIKALGMLMQSYMRNDLNRYLDDLPRESGAALVFDDNNERMYNIRVRARLSWHGGSAPSAIDGANFDF
ncbi:ATP-binding protein [Pseudomonadota bacterium]